MGVAKYAAKDNFKELQSSMKNMYSDFARLPGFNLVRESTKNTRSLMQRMRNPNVVNNPQAITLSRRFQSIPLINNLTRSVNKTFDNIAKGKIWQDVEDEDIFGGGDFDDASFSSEYDDFDFENIDQYIMSNDEIIEDKDVQAKSKKKFEKISNKKKQGGEVSLNIAKAQGQLTIASNKALANSMSLTMQTLHVERTTLLLKNHAEVTSELKTMSAIQNRLLENSHLQLKNQMTMIEAMQGIAEELKEIKTDQKTIGGVSKTGELRSELSAYHQSFSEMIGSGQLAKGLMGGFQNSAQRYSDKKGGGMFSSIMQIAPFLPMFINSKTLTQGAMKMGGQKLLGNNFDKLEEFMTNPAKAIGTALASLAYSKNNVLSTMFSGFDESRRIHVNDMNQRTTSGKKPEDRTNWTNADSEALQIVIPALLGKILSSNSGRPEEAYDYRSRTFKTKQQAMKEQVRHSPLDVEGVKRLASEQLSFFKSGKINKSKLDNYHDVVYDPKMQKELEQSYVTILLTAIKNGVDPKILLSNGDPKKVADKLGIQNSEAVDIVMNMMRALNKPGTSGSLAAINKNAEMAKSYRQNVESYNANIDYSNRYGSMGVFGANMEAPPYITEDTYKQWYEYWSMKGKTPDQINAMENAHKKKTFGMISPQLTKAQFSEFKRLKRLQQREMSDIDNSSYASTYSGRGGGGTNSRSSRSDGSRKQEEYSFEETNVIEATLADGDFIATLVGSPADKKNKLIKEYINSKRDITHSTATKLSRILMKIGKGKNVANKLSAYGGSDNAKDYKVTDADLAAYQEQQANRTQLDTSSVSSMAESVQEISKEYYGTAKGKKTFNIGMGAAIGGIAGIMLKRSAGLRSPFMLPLLAASIGSGFGLANKFSNITGVLMGEEGDALMGNNKSKRESLISNLVTNILPASIIGSSIGKKVSGLTKKYVRYGAILGPILGAVTGVGSAFAISQMDLIRKALKGLGVGKLLGKTKIGGKIAGFMGIGADDKTESTKDVIGENKGTIMDGGIDNTGLVQKEGEEKEGKGLLATAAIAFVGYKAIKKLMQISFKQKLKNGQGIDAVGCALSAVAYSLANLLKDKTIRVTDFINIANNHIGAGGGVRTSFFKEVASRYSIPIDIYEGKRSYSDKKLKNDLKKGAQVVVLADLIKGKPHYVVGVQGSNDGVKLFDPMAGESRGKENELSFRSFLALGSTFIVLHIPRAGFFNRPIYSAENNGEEEENYGLQSHRGSYKEGKLQEAMGPGSDLKTTTMGIKDKARIAIGGISPFGKTKAILQTLVHFLDPLLFNSDYIRDVMIRQYGALKKLPRKREFTIGRQFGIVAKAQNFLRALNPMNALKDMWNGSFGLIFQGINKTFNGIKNTLNSVKDGIGSVVKSIAASFGWMWDKMGLGNITKGIKNLGVATLRTVIAPGKFVFNQLFGKDGAIRGHIMPFLKEMGSSIGQGIKGFLSAPIDGIKKLGGMAKAGAKKLGSGLQWLGGKAVNFTGNMIDAGLAGAGQIGRGIKGMFQGKGLSGFTEEKIMTVRVASGHIDTVGSVGTVDIDVYRSAIKRSKNSLIQGTAGKFKSAISHGINDSAAFYRSNTDTRHEDQLQDQIKANELKNTTLLERIADGAGGEDDNKKEKKGGLMDVLKSILMAMPFLLWEIGQQVGNPAEYAKNVGTNLTHVAMKTGLKVFNKGVKFITKATGFDGIKYLGKNFVKGAGKEAVEDVSKVAIKSSVREGTEIVAKQGVKSVVKEGAEAAAKEGAKNPKVISKLVKTIVDVTTKFAAKASGLPLIGKFFKKGLGKAIAEAAPKIGKEIGENVAKEAAESGTKSAVKQGARVASSGLKDAGAATLGISYVVGFVIDLKFFAYDVQDGWRHAHDDFQVQPKEVTTAMQISSATAGGLISALSSAVTMIPGLSLIMTAVSIIIAMIPRALVARIIYDIVRKYLDMDRERDYDTKEFEVTIIGEESHAEYEALKKKVKEGTATDEERAKYEQYYDKLEKAKKDQVKEDKKKEKEATDKEKNKQQNIVNNNAYNYYNPYAPQTNNGKNPYTGYNPYQVPSGKGAMDDLFKAAAGGITNASSYFTSQLSGPLSGRNLGTESMKSNGCAVAVAKMIFKFLKRNITTDTLIRIAKNHLDRTNATKITFFEELGGRIVNNREDLTKRLQKKGTAAAMLRQGRGNNHYVAVFNDNGTILMGDPEKTEVESITLDGYEIKTMISAAVFNIDDTPFDIANLNLSGKGTGDDDGDNKEEKKESPKPIVARAKIREAIGSKRDFSTGYKRSGVNPLEMNTKKTGGVSMGGNTSTAAEVTKEAVAPAAAAATEVASNAGNAVGQPVSPHGNIVKVLGGSGSGRYTDVQYADGTKMRRKGDRAWRNHNPGNMDIAANGAGGWQLAFGILGNDKGEGFKYSKDGRQPVFPNYEAGHKAMYELLFNRGYKDKKISQAIQVYAPPSENATQKYIQMASNGIAQNVLSGPLGAYPEADRKKLMDNMKTVEGGKPGTEEPLTGGAGSPGAIFVAQNKLLNPPQFPIDAKVAGCAIAVAKMVCRHLGNGMTDGKLYEAAKKNIKDGMIHINFFQVIPGGSISTTSSPKQIDDLLNRGEGAIALLTKKNGSRHYVMLMNFDGKKYIGDPEGSKFWDYNINNDFVKNGMALSYWQKNKITTKNVDGFAKGTTAEQTEQIKNGEAVASSVSMKNSEIAAAQNSYNASISSTGKSGLSVETISVQTLTDSSGKRISFGGTTAAATGGTPSGPSAWLDVARQYLNKATAADVAMFHKEGGNMNADYKTAWCTSFASYCLKKSGFTFPGSASSQYPISTEGKKWFDQLSGPQVGAVIVWAGPKAGYGHTAFVTAVGDAGKIKWIGGNQKATGEDDGSINGKNVTEKNDFTDPSTGGIKGRRLVGYFWPKTGSGGSTNSSNANASTGNQSQPDTTNANDPKNDPKKNPKATAGDDDSQLQATNSLVGADKKDLLSDKFKLGKSTLDMLPGSKLFDSEKNMQMKRGLDQNTRTYKEPLWQKLGRGALDVFVGTKGFSRDGIQSYVQGAISKQAQEWMSPWIDGMKAENKAVLERLGQGNADIVSELQKITNNTGIANDMNNRLQVPQGGNVTNNLFNSNSNLGGEFSELTQTMNKWMTEFSLDNVKA